jgi:hypothetical protein
MGLGERLGGGSGDLTALIHGGTTKSFGAGAPALAASLELLTVRRDWIGAFCCNR